MGFNCFSIFSSSGFLLFFKLFLLLSKRISSSFFSSSFSFSKSSFLSLYFFFHLFLLLFCSFSSFFDCIFRLLFGFSSCGFLFSLLFSGLLKEHCLLFCFSLSCISFLLFNLLQSLEFKSSSSDSISL